MGQLLRLQASAAQKIGACIVGIVNPCSDGRGTYIEINDTSFTPPADPGMRHITVPDSAKSELPLRVRVQVRDQENRCVHACVRAHVDGGDPIPAGFGSNSR